jgi:dephospho-CoA kinase
VFVSDRVLRVALTGGIATGKSACLRRFSARGVPVIDADVLAREVISAGTSGYLQVLERFGADIGSPETGIDRARLGHLVFTDSNARRNLEAIIHPLVYGRIAAWFAELGTKVPPPTFGIADVPLLYETGHQTDFDLVIVAACSPQQQLERLMARDELSADEAQQRLAAQWPIDRKRELADYVIDTSGTYASTDARIADLIDEISQRR